MDTHERSQYLGSRQFVRQRCDLVEGSGAERVASAGVSIEDDKIVLRGEILDQGADKVFQGKIIEAGPKTKDLIKRLEALEAKVAALEGR